MRTVFTFTVLLTISLGCQKAASSAGIPPQVTIAPPAVIDREDLHSKFPPSYSFVKLDETEKKEPTTKGDGATQKAVAEYQERTKQMLEAADKGRLSLILELVKKGADVNDKDDDGTTALHKAVAKDHRNVIFALVLFGADLCEKDNKGRTPLMVAAESGSPELLVLLANGGALSSQVADAESLTKLKDLKIDSTALFNRLRPQCEAALEVADKEGRTVPMICVDSGDAETLRKLNISSTAILRKNKKGQNAIHLAAAAGRVDVMSVLLEGYYSSQMTKKEILTEDGMGKTALDLAEAGNHKPMVKTLWTKLAMIAAADGDLDSLKDAMAKLPKDVDSGRFFDAAVSKGRAVVVKHFLNEWKNKPTEVKLKLLHADQEEVISSSLMNAVISGNLDAVKLLLDLEWWKDKEGLIKLIKYSARRGSVQVDALLTNDYFSQIQPEITKLIHAKLMELEGQPKK